ncbi:pyridoxamine 5'-phosphate oxidase family protein [Catellatospora coxensis]|uniref:Phosphohydrolase n=1 Tax=Catellatospora coxensis TaxID=310354 RepID=A0A8J3PAS2_9ACTN|nr:pyridoxamine 5'-phosphate oxidase family protein [Catellatospora coxensis]GIG09693.1 phosphohydrolase [Catellatospora coxensis]
MSESPHRITTPEQLRALLGEPTAAVVGKTRTSLHEYDRAWLAASSFCLVATSHADGSCDVSPKGDPAGFTLVLDDTTIAIPERPGNRRADGFFNILSNPQLGLLYVIPGRTDTLRINGHAELVSDAPFFDDMVVKGHRPRLAVIVSIDEVFYHCSKSFLRSALWKPETWQPEAAPSRPRIAQTLERPDQTVEELAAYYGPAYEERIYS